MGFRVLGPLTIGDEAANVSLGGLKQRATLGFLLLHANQVVASSTLMRALWFNEVKPVTARKILHNAVWRLRTILAPTTGPQLARLDTRPPGYVLQVDPAEVDLLRFREAVTEGRKALADHDAETAAVLLGNALRLWRGQVLADLADQGLSWPELKSLNETRLDAQEDWFEAELDCGRHHAILAELHAVLNDGSLRERVCGQLMLALYRCGRQVEALSVYTQMRGRLSELGLDPSEDLRRLQHAILNQDPALTAPSPPVTLRRPGPTAPVPEPPARPTLVPRQRSAEARRQVSMLMVRTAPAEATGTQDLDEILASTTADVSAVVERAGGVMVASIGSTSVAVFGLPDAAADDADRAVCAAITIRDRFGPDFAARAVITTGSLRLSDTNSIPKAVAGTLADRCQQMIAEADVGEIWVCDTTRHATSDAITFSSDEGLDNHWLVCSMPSTIAMPEDVPLVDRESEMTLVASVIGRAYHRAHPHLVTILGDAGTGKTRFLAELRRRFNATALPSDLPLRESPSAVHATLLGARLGIDLGDRPATTRAKLAMALDGRLDLVEGVLPLWTNSQAPPSPAVLEAWTQTMTELYRDEPLVVTVDDLQSATDTLLNAVRELVTASPALPLCVVVGARPTLIERCPGWGTGITHSATITLDPLTDEAIDHVVEHLTVRPKGPEPDWFRKMFSGNQRAQVRKLLQLSH